MTVSWSWSYFKVSSIRVYVGTEDYRNKMLNQLYYIKKTIEGRKSSKAEAEFSDILAGIIVIICYE